MRQSKTIKRSAQKAAAVLTAGALVAGFLPFQVLDVFADEGPSVQFGLVLDTEDLVGDLTLMYSFDGQETWTRVTDGEFEEADQGVGIYTFSIASLDPDITGMDLGIGFEDNIVEAGYTGDSADFEQAHDPDMDLVTFMEEENAVIYHYDDYTQGDHWFFFDFASQGVEPSADVIDQDTTITEDITIHGGESLTIVNCEVVIGSDAGIYIESGGNLILEGTADIENTDRIFPEEGASISFNGAEGEPVSIPDGIVLHTSDLNPIEDDPQFEWWAEFVFTDGIWVEAMFADPLSFCIRIDDSSDLTGTACSYTAEYRVSGTDDWHEVSYDLFDGFPYPDSVSGGTVTLEQGQWELMNIYFRLPDELWQEDPEGEYYYPNIDLRITVTDDENIMFGGAYLGDEEISDDLLDYDNDRVTVTLTDIDVFAEETPHDISLIMYTQFDSDECFGINVIAPFDVQEFSRSEDGKTITINCMDGNKLIFTSESEIITQKIDGTEDSPIKIVLWSEADTFSIETAPSSGYTAYIYGEGDRTPIPAGEPYIIEVEEQGNADDLNIGFEMAGIRIDNYIDIQGGEYNTYGPDDWERDETLPGTSYTFVYEGGTVTIELTSGGNGWRGAQDLFTEGDSGDEGQTFFASFCIRTGDQIKITYAPEEGYVINSFIRDDLELELDEDNSCIINIEGDRMAINEPFRPQDPVSYGTAVFTGALGMNMDDQTGKVIVTYENGYLTVTNTDDAAVFEIREDQELGWVIDCDTGLYMELFPDDGYQGSITIDGNNLGTEASIDPIEGSLPINVDLTGDTFVLNIRSGAEPVQDPEEGTITFTFEHGTLAVSGFDSVAEIIGVSPGGSQIIDSYDLVLEGNSAAIAITPDEGYMPVILQDGQRVEAEGGMLYLEDICKDNEIKVEVNFDPLPTLTIGSDYTFDEQEGSLTYTGGKVTIQGNPFTDPGSPNLISEDIVFEIEPEEGYICYAVLSNAEVEERGEPVSGTYTLDHTRLRSLANTLVFSFEPIEEDQMARVSFNGEYTEDSGSYKIQYEAGYILIDAGQIHDAETSGGDTIFTVDQAVTSLAITFVPDSGFVPAATLAYSDTLRDIDITDNEGQIGVDPMSAETYAVTVSFNLAATNQAYVTYTYEGTGAGIKFGDNPLPSGTLNNRAIEFANPLVPDGEGNIDIEFSIPFNRYISEVIVNGVDYSDQVPDTYDELLAAFNSQHTVFKIQVPISDSYEISTVAIDARWNDDPEQTTLAVGNFLWFYDDAHIGHDDYVRNARLEVVQVEVGDTVYTADDTEAGSAIFWEDIVADGEILGGSAVLPAGSLVTMKFIPDYGTQLVSLGLNGGSFDADPDNMYSYTFRVGPGNFHLQADFEPVEDVVENNASAVTDGQITLGEGTIDNGTAVLFVDDTVVEGDELEAFEAASDGMQISSYLDISLDKVVYQGTDTSNVVYDGADKNIWNEELSELSAPAQITLALEARPDSEDIKVLHYHNGSIEVLDAEYDPDNNTITFETSSFSDYAIATVGSPENAATPTPNATTAPTSTPVPTATTAPTATATPKPTATPTPASSASFLTGGTAHVQDTGNMSVTVDPDTGIMSIGTTGQAKRLEQITINFKNPTQYSGTLQYRVHVQDIGWMDWTDAGRAAGTTGQAKRIEAIEMRLTGELAEHYSVEYTVHIQDYGDMQGWVSDGTLAGTTGESKRIEQVKVRIVPRGQGTATTVSYRVHVENKGWETSYVSGGQMSGTTGQALRLEGIEIFVTGNEYSGGIRYRTHVQNIGWESAWTQNGEMSGTQGQSLRLEGIQIELTGELAEHYDIYYRVHAQDIGWLSWASNGASAGTAARSARLEGIQIVLVPKGGGAPGKTYKGITSADSRAFVQGF